jgi:hypothetical protein
MHLEWYALTIDGKQHAHPVTLQLATYDGVIIAVLHLIYMYANLD